MYPHPLQPAPAPQEVDGTKLPHVATVVLNWHGRANTLRCLRALAALSYSPLSVVLIDNGCREFSAEEVSDLLPNARYVRTDTNLGFAGGANLGMRQALGDGADHVWFLNNDAEPEPGALSEMLAVAQQHAATGIVGPKILLGQDPQRLDSIALRINLRRGRLYLLGHDEVDRGQYDHLSQVDAVSGCAVLVSRPACEQLGGFDESFFAYVEDADLCLRARAAGFCIRVAPRARVVHNRTPATGGRQSTSSLYYATRNHLKLIHRHAPVPRLPRLALVVFLNAAYALRAGGSSRLARLRAVWRGVSDYQRGIAGPGWTE